MTHSQRIEYATAALVGCCLAGSLSHPAWAWLDYVAFVALLAGTWWARRARTPMDDARARRHTWLLPAVALALAVQWVVFTPPRLRWRTAGPMAVLVVVAMVMAGRRRD